MKSVKIAAIILAAGMATGCASSGLQSQIDDLNSQISQASADAASAKASAASAAADAASAKEEARRAAQIAQDTNSKLDRMFKKSMMK
ncbi:MAG: hypothetical protein KAT04_02330 [Methylococcales bacterium]|nr:hypothetical protein [Methylococcales bacterium]